MADRLDEGKVRGRSELPPFAVAPVFQPSVLDQPHLESPPVEPALSHYGELDCIRHRLPSRLIAAAEQRAAESGVGADRVLIACGAISEEDYLRAFSTWHGLAFEPLEGTPARSLSAHRRSIDRRGRRRTFAAAQRQLNRLGGRPA